MPEAVAPGLAAVVGEAAGEAMVAGAAAAGGEGPAASAARSVVKELMALKLEVSWAGREAVQEAT